MVTKETLELCKRNSVAKDTCTNIMRFPKPPTMLLPVDYIPGLPATQLLIPLLQRQVKSIKNQPCHCENNQQMQK